MKDFLGVFGSLFFFLLKRVSVNYVLKYLEEMLFNLFFLLMKGVYDILKDLKEIIENFFF